MQDDTMAAEATGAKSKAKGKGGKATPVVALTGEETQIARTMIRVFWLDEWTAANPDKSVADRVEAWKANRQAVTNAELRKMRRIVLTLGRLGVVMSMPEKAPKADAPSEETSSEAEA